MEKFNDNEIMTCPLELRALRFSDSLVIFIPDMNTINLNLSIHMFVGTLWCCWLSQEFGGTWKAIQVIEPQLLLHNKR